MKPSKITIHCSATPNGKPVSVETIRKWHIDRGFTDIGYHFIIQPNGDLEFGRPIYLKGAHVKGANKDNIGVCFIGDTKFSKAQFNTFYSWAYPFCQKYDVPFWAVYAHNEFKSAIKQGKTCPNMDIKQFNYWFLKGEWDAIQDYIEEKKEADKA